MAAPAGSSRRVVRCPLGDPAQWTPTQRAEARQFVVSRGVYGCTTFVAQAAAQHLGGWWEFPEAEHARRALDEVLAASAVPSAAWSVVEDLVHFVRAGESFSAVNPTTGFRTNTVLRRRTAFTTGAPAPPPGRDEWLEGDTSQKPSALLLTHTFADTPLPGATLTLRTLFLEDCVYEVAPETMLRDVFGERAPALSAQLLHSDGSTYYAPTLHKSGSAHYAPTTDVEIDGVPLFAAQLAALSQRARRAVAAARRAQLLTALRDCLGGARWAGGFLALRHFADELVGGLAARLWTEPLAARLVRARAGGLPTGPLVESLLYLAAAHMDVKQHAQAAALMREAGEAHQQAAEQHGFWSLGRRFNPALPWYHCGNCESRAGREAAAIAAYRRGLAALDAACALYAAEGVPPDSTTVDLRLNLPSAIVVAALDGGLAGELDHELLLRMFNENAAFRAATAQGAGNQALHITSHPTSVITATLHPSRRVFSMTNARGKWEILELPPGGAVPVNVHTRRAVDDPVRFDRCLPNMAAARCAGCGAARRSGVVPFKTCAACGMVHYCGKDCQVAHWPAHKAACKAACKAAAAASGSR